MLTVQAICQAGSLGVGWFRRFQDTNIALMDQALVSGTNFLTGILLARFLGIEEFGRYTLIWMLVLLVNVFQQAFLLQPMMSLGPKQPVERLGRYFAAVAAQQGILCLILGGFVLLAGLFMRWQNPNWPFLSLMLPLSAVIVTFQAQEYVRRYFFTRQKLKDAFVNDLISYAGQVILLVLWVQFFPLKTEMVLWITALTSALAVLFAVPAFDAFQWCQSVFQESLRVHWNFAKWLAGGSLMQWLSGQFFVIVAAQYLSVAAVGAIAAARNILGFTLILFAATENVVSVRASLVFSRGGKDALITYLKKILWYGGLANGAICLVAALFAPFWMKLLFGAAYVQYAYLVYWFAATHFLMYFIRPLVSFLRTVEVTKPIATASFLPLIFSLLASVPLIRMVGLVGAMIVMLGTQMLTLIYLVGATVLWRKEQT